MTALVLLLAGCQDPIAPADEPAAEELCELSQLDYDVTCTPILTLPPDSGA